jgi:hypothetical protein
LPKEQFKAFYKSPHAAAHQVARTLFGMPLIFSDAFLHKRDPLNNPHLKFGKGINARGLDTFYTRVMPSKNLIIANVHRKLKSNTFELLFVTPY